MIINSQDTKHLMEGISLNTQNTNYSIRSDYSLSFFKSKTSKNVNIYESAPNISIKI